ncbi:protein kinase subdomain-containing protein PKL/ccin9 [Lactarius psammicola]|nr:protein kinase subdomain-containing protein PKL/ccin9 [Lactarius psammicola]
MAESDYKLCCLAEHDHHPFSVSISPTGTINDLKELIFRERVKALLQCHPADFALTKVSFDLEACKSDILAGEFEPNSNDMGVSLLDDPTATISQVWSTKPLSGHVHVFVGLPTTTVLGKRPHAVDSVQDFKHTKTVPSQMGELPNYESLQRQPTEKILDDRPEPYPVPPVSLLYDGFGYFMDEAFRNREDVPEISTKRRNLEMAVNAFADEMTGFYYCDASRSFEGLPALNNILALGDGKKFRAVDINTVLSDKPCVAASCLVWFKNEFVNIGSPMVDLATYATRSRELLMQHFNGVDNGWRTPFLGVTVIGPYVTFYAIIFLQQWRIVSLTHTLSCIASACEGNDRKSLYAAFTGALALLRRIDEDVTRFISAPPTIQHADPNFPYLSALPKYGGAPDEKVHFRILRPHPDNRLLYIAETLDLEKMQIIVKFTRSYSIALHAFCTGRGYAPSILGFGKIPGGWSVVAMEYIVSSVHPSRSPNLARLCNKWVDELQKLVQSFHEKGLVHGDLRESNILCDGEDVVLIDFDWGGRVGEAAYPFVRLSSELTNGRDSTDPKITKDDDRRVLHNTLEQLKKHVAYM